MRDMFHRWLAVSSCGLLLMPGCGEGFANFTASLGGDRAGSRGDVRLVFINNTPFRAVFTFGTLDRNNPDYQPDASQFLLEDATLDGNDATDIGALECARVFAVGTPELLDLIERNLDVPIDQTAFIEGVAFYDVQNGSEPQLVGLAPPFEALLGVDFPCEALLILRFELGDDGEDSFRVDFELIPSRSTR